MTSEPTEGRPMTNPDISRPTAVKENSFIDLGARYDSWRVQFADGGSSAVLVPHVIEEAIVAAAESEKETLLSERDRFRDRLIEIADFEPNISGDADFATVKAMAQETLSPGSYAGENPYQSPLRALQQTVDSLRAVADLTREWVALIDEARGLLDEGPLPITMEIRSNDLLARVRAALAASGSISPTAATPLDTMERLREAADTVREWPAWKQKIAAQDYSAQRQLKPEPASPPTPTEEAAPLEDREQAHYWAEVAPDMHRRAPEPPRGDTQP